MNFKLFYESFDTPTDLFLNPLNKNKSLEEILEEFYAEGGKYIGNGSCGEVFYHPKWNYVVKTFKDDPYYLRFARFAYKNPHPAFPKIYGPPQRIVPFYKRMKSSSMIYLARIELLYPIDDQELMKQIMSNIDYSTSYFRAKQYGQENEETEKQTRTGRGKDAKWEIVKEKVYKREIELFEKYPKLYPLFEAFYIISTAGLNGNIDLNKNNYMQRKDGSLVLIDPLWAGSNPYADADRLRKSEMDYYGYEDYEEDPKEIKWDLLGGQISKNKRKKKIKPQIRKPFKHDPDDPPF
jgi:hypothetical protein